MERCTHELTQVAGVGVVACPTCATIDWWGPDGLVDPTEALQHLFGGFELEGSLPALAAPAPKVLVYRPTSRRDRRHLEAFPIRTWLSAHPGLWLSHDGERLVLAPVDRQIVDTLGA
jgi:hypothetical protein